MDISADWDSSALPDQIPKLDFPSTWAKMSALPLLSNLGERK
jgi:hypothetical protein